MYLCMIELMIQVLGSWLCLMNYDCVFKTYDCVFYDKMVISVQIK